MPEGLPELLQDLGSLGALIIVVVYLLLRDRNNKRSSNPGNPGLVNGRWQQEMKQAQDTANATLGRIEGGMKEAVRLLQLMEDRQQRE